MSSRQQNNVNDEKQQSQHKQFHNLDNDPAQHDQQYTQQNNLKSMLNWYNQDLNRVNMIKFDFFHFLTASLITTHLSH